MEANNHFNFTGLPSSPAASGLKPAPSSGDNVYTNGSPMNFPQQGKSLNGDMNVNGLSTVSHASTSGTRSSNNSHLHHPYDYLWNYSQYPSGNGNSLKDGPLFSQYPLNGTLENNRQNSPGHNTSLRGSSGQEFWANGTPGTMGLNFDSTELYDSFPDDQNFEILQNGPTSFYTSSQPSPMLASGNQDFSPQQDEPGNEEAVKEPPSAAAENGSRLLGSMELENAQPELKICGYNGSSPVVEPLSQEASVLEPDAGASCLEDASRIPPPPLEDSLEPFESLDRDPGTGDLYEMDTSELVSGKSPLEDPPDISALDCPGSPSLNHSDSFSLLADDSQPDTSLFGSANLPPVLGESVLQESSLELTGVSEVGQEGTEFLDSQASLEPESLNASLEEAVKSSGSDNPTSLTDRDSKEASLLNVSAKSDVPRRRIATVEEVYYPLKHGWRREVRIKKGSNRWQGETWYYGPCGKRMKQFPEVIKYLSRNDGQNVRREHFSFSPRMPVGDFFEERDTSEGLQWVKLSHEEIPSRIQAITGKRGRPRNTEKIKAKEMPKVKRGRGRPPKVKGPDLLSKTDSRVLKKLETQEFLSDEDKLKMTKIKKKMRQKVQNKQKQEAKTTKSKETKSKEAKKKTKPQPQIKKEKSKPDKSKPEKPNEKVKLKEKAKAKEKKGAPSGKVPRKADKNLLAQRRQEERQRQQMILEEMKKPTEDMCLGDHQPLPEFSRIPGLVLPSQAFSDCLAIVEFLHNYGKVLGFDVAREIPSLSTLQEGLFNVGDSLGEVLDLLVKLVKVALYDPGLPSCCQALKILGEKLTEISLNRDTVSEVLRCFLIAYGGDGSLCDSLRTKPFQALPPDKKAAILAFLVNELNSGTLIINEIDKTLESMSNHRRNKWIIEGKLRRLKIALAKKTGRPESEITGLEEGRWRRSSRIIEENEDKEIEEEERRRGCKAQRDNENESLISSVPELERQIEKLSKRQMFFRKKLLHSSQLLRASSLGQDRYRRRYWVLPHLGGIFIEGCEASEASLPVSKNSLEKGEALKEEEHEAPSVKKENTDTPSDPDYMNCTTSRSWSWPWRGNVGMSPPEHLESKLPEPTPLSVNGFLEDPVSLGQSQHDLSQSAFLSWLSQTQQASSLFNSSVLTPDSSPGKGDQLPPDDLPDSTADDESISETQVTWFNLLPRTCNDSSLAPSTERPSRTSQLCKPSTKDQSKTSAQQLNGYSASNPALPPLSSTPLHSSSRVHSTCSRSKENSKKILEPLGQPRRRGRPPTKLFKQIEQKYLTQLTAQPIPPEMQSGWWWLQDPEELEAVLEVLHPRGIREKALQKHLTKHKDYLRDVCARAASDPIFKVHSEVASHLISQEALAQWSMSERAFETDLSVLQWVEELEQRVLMADLQIRGWTSPDPDSVRKDLRYCERELELLEDITVKNKREGPVLQRESNNPLDLAVLRLADLEQNLERRYLREPLWPMHEVVVEKALLSHSDTLEQGATEVTYEITPRMRMWRQTLERCHSAAQVSLCIYQLELSIAWEKSVVRATCLVCRKGDDDENLLLCDSCDRGCHLYCHRPKMAEVPDGDWFCSLCIAQMQGEYQDEYGSPRRGKKRKSGLFGGKEELSPRSRSAAAAASQQHSGVLSNTSPRYSGEGLSPSKRRRVSTRGQSADLTFCEIILMEMESHEAAWPFLEPVNPRLVPGYRKIIKNPMDFATMRARLLRGGYSSCEEFAADAFLVFDNCRTFNEDESEVGKAGLAMRHFFESRWEEFYQGKQETNP